MIDIIASVLEKYQTLVVALCSSILTAIVAFFTSHKKLSKDITALSARFDNVCILFTEKEKRLEETRVMIAEHNALHSADDFITKARHDKMQLDCQAQWKAEFVSLEKSREKELDAIRKLIVVMDTNHHERIEELKEFFNSSLKRYLGGTDDV